MSAGPTSEARPGRVPLLPGFALRMLVVVGLAVSLTLGGVLWWTGWRDHARLREVQRSRALRSLQLLEILIGEQLESARGSLRGLAASSAVQEGLTDGSSMALLGAVQTLRDDSAVTHVVIESREGKALAMTSRLAALMLGPNPVHADERQAEPAVGIIAGDVALLLDQPVRRGGTTLGWVRGFSLIGRLFVTRMSEDLQAPLAIFLEGELMHHSFPASPPLPARPSEGGPVFSRATLEGEPFLIAYKKLEGVEADLWIAAGTAQGEELGATRRFLLLAGLAGGGGLAVVLLATGVFLALAQQQERLARQRDTAVRRSEGLSERLAHLAAVVHDIKAPVGGIQLRAEGMIEDSAETAHRSGLEQIAETCERLQLYLANILTAAQAEEGPIPLREEAVLVAGLIEDVCEKVSPLAGRRGVGLAREVGPDLPPLTGDHVFLERALTNLAVNAIAATPPGGTVTLFGARSEGRLVLGSRDTGLGFKAFDPAEAFSRHRPQVKDSSLRSGTGLGLFIVARIAEAHKGAAYAENLPEGGARVWLDLPLSK